MPRRRGDGPGHARACRQAQEAAVRGLVADGVTEGHEAHAAARRELAGSARAFLSETALLAVRALNGAGAPALLLAMHRIVNAVQPGLISPGAALYGHWMEWRESDWSGRPLSMRDTLQLTKAGSAMSLRSSVPALLHALRTRCPGDTAPYLNQARRSTFYSPRTRTPTWAKSQCSWKVRTRRPPAPGRPTRYTTAPGRPPRTPSYARRSPGSPPGAPPSRQRRTRPAAGPTRTGPPPLSTTRGAHHRGQVLWQERPGTSLLLLLVATRGDPERVLGITPTHLYGAAPVPRPPLPAPAVRDGVHTFLRTQGVTAVTAVHPVRLPPAPPDDPRGPRALSPAPDWELWRDAWAARLPRLPPHCRWMATSPRPYGAEAAASPPPPPPIPPRGALHSTARGTTQVHREVVGRAHLPQRMPTR